MKQEQGKNTFLGSRMDKDTDSRLLEQGVYRDALNVRVGNSSGSDVGALENSLSNKKLTNYSFGANATCIGMYADKSEQKIYWFVKSDDGDYLMEHDFANGATSVVLEDTSAGILNFNKEYLITGVNIIIDTDKRRRLLYWTDNLNPPRGINIERAKTYGANNFTEEQISVIKAPPLQKPVIALGQTDTGQENNIEEKFLRFAYRYKYLDGEYSALSSFSETAFLAKPFDFDYAISANESMVNNFSKVSIAFNTGSKLVTEIDIVFKESGTNTVYLVDNYKKESKGWGDNENQFVEFFNNKIKKALDQDQLFRLYDAVPLRAKAQELIGNRLTYGFYTENYNIEDSNGSAIDVDFLLEGINTAITNSTPTESLKSNRDYEIGIVYLDKYGRQTSVLTSENNTINFPNIDSLTQNQIKAVVNSPAPSFAEKFRFYIKQTREDYDIIVPTLFYVDGPYVWVKLEGSEDNKIEEGEYLYVKADTQEVLPQLEQTKVLEIKNQPKDFLEDGDKQLSGNYMRLKPNNYRLNPDDYEFYDWNSYDSSKNINDNPIRGNQSYVEPAVYYGTSLSDDLTSSGTYTGTVDERYKIEIITTGATDEFRWTKDEGQNWSANIPITGAAQAIENGVEITFASITGHSLDDSWAVGAKSSSDDGLGGQENSKAYGLFKGPDTGNGIIFGGARIEWEYSEYGEETQKITRNFISTRRYENIEEWYYGDNIYDEISEIGESRIWFRRGTVAANTPVLGIPSTAKHITIDPAGDMVMIVRSKGTQNSDLDGVVKLRTGLEIFQAQQNVIFETIPFSNDAAPFFEIGQTYDVVNGFHTSSNTSDVDQALGVAGEFVLDVFNCIAWGNAFESYKIKDLFNAKAMKIDTRPSDSIEEYAENIRIASLTYSKVYEQTLNYNGTNEFNLSTINFKDLDDKYSSIQKLFSRDTDLIVFQEDKLHKLPFAKDILFTAAGEGAVTESNEVFGKEVPYAGEFGISLNPESFAFYGNSIYFTDQRRGSVMRLNLNGLVPISDNGMKDFFRDNFRRKNTKKLGGLDLYNKQYVLYAGDEEIPIGSGGNGIDPNEGTTPTPGFIPFNCGSKVEFQGVTTATPLKVKALQTQGLGDIFVNFSFETACDIQIDNNGDIINFPNEGPGLGSVSFTQTYDDVDFILVTITPIATGSYEVKVGSPCLVPDAPAPDPVVANDDTFIVYKGTVDNVFNVLFNDSYEGTVTITITSAPTEGTAVVSGNNILYTHTNIVDGDVDSLTYQIDDGLTTDTAVVSISALTDPGGGGNPNEGTAFQMSTSTALNPAQPDNGQVACSITSLNTYYHNGAFFTPGIGDKIYTDLYMANPVVGGNEYRAIELGRTIRIDNTGTVTDVFICE